MKLGWKIWLLAIFLISSLILIINLPTSTSMMVLGLFIGILFVLINVKSNFGKILIIFILLASMIFLIYTQTESGLIIKSVELNSTAYNSGLRQGQIITSINSNEVETLSDYTEIINSEFIDEENKKIIIQTKDEEYILFTNTPPKIVLQEIPKTDIKLGLDLQGGSRALIKAQNQSLNYDEIQDLISITENRLNVYGLSDMKVRQVSDLSGNNYMLLEIAGATPSELEELISKQGKFEARIANQTVFIGGEDIAHVERSGQYSGIEGCFPSETGGEVCRFRFAISLTEKAAKKHAEITENLSISTENPEYLSEKLDLYVDDALMDSLFISKDLKGRETTQISIQGSGSGKDRQEAIEDTQQNMKRLQTILITGSLPYKLEIVKLDTISPLLGRKFIRSIIIAGLAALAAVALIVLLRYRKIKLPLALLLTSFSEVLIVLGIASLIKWNLDLPSIAGIIAVIGTGVDQQIVVLDESRSGVSLSLKQRLKRAGFIILGSYATTMFAMMPLITAGAGLLKGFAITTMIGISVGVFITRPAFAEIVKKIVE